MTTERVSHPAAAARAGAARYARPNPANEPFASTVATVTANVLGIPEAEFTTRVRQAVMKLMADVDNLRQELGSLRSRLEDAERAADQDQLLPILNRRAFVRELSRHIASVGRYGAPASLVYFDLDGFKTVNDTHGHAAGDAVLKHFTEMLGAHVRESDVVGRIGGDEFALILPHAREEQANRKAASLVDALSASPALWSGAVLSVRLSYGVFELRPGDSAETALSHADNAMYARKRNK